MFGGIRRGLPVALFLAFAITITGTLSAGAGERSIYDSRVETRVDGLTEAQRAEVEKILEESNRQLEIVFKKYDIDPYSRPRFFRLWAASSELRAIGEREREAMKQVLNDEQMAQYDQAIEETRQRVSRALVGNISSPSR